jgi:hypothetical protein
MEKLLIGIIMLKPTKIKEIMENLMIIKPIMENQPKIQNNYEKKP